MPDGISVNVVEADPIVVNVIDGPDTITSTIIEEVIHVSIDGIVGPIGPHGVDGTVGFYVSTGDPNNDSTVPSPPPDERSLCVDTSGTAYYLWYWYNDQWQTDIAIRIGKDPAIDSTFLTLNGYLNDEIARAEAAEADNATALVAHDADTTDVHGIADTGALATRTYADSADTAVANAASSALADVAAAMDAADNYLGTRIDDVTVYVDAAIAAAGGIYRHTQSSPNTTWTVHHNLGFRPAVTVEDSGGSVVHGDVTHVDANTLTLAFGVAFGGFANCS